MENKKSNKNKRKQNIDNTGINKENKAEITKEESKVKKPKFKERVPKYFLTPMYFALMLVPFAVWFGYHDLMLGIIVGGAVVAYLLFALGFYYYCKSRFNQELVDFAMDYTQVQKKMIKELEIPYGLIDTNGKFLWGNKALISVCDISNLKYISDVFDEIDVDKLKPGTTEKEKIIVNYNNKTYRFEYSFIGMDDKPESEDETNYVIAIYLFDETDIRKLSKENYEQRMVCGLIYIDNYEEVLASVESARSSLLIALIERRINKYFSGYNALVKKLEKDRYLIIIKQKYISMLQSNKFSILDEVKTVNVGNEMAVTLSMGFGVNGVDYKENYELARIAMDFALGRGGDQAVVKAEEKTYFYGGKSKQVEKNTRVKARIKAHALRELMYSKDKVMIMGHTLGDTDSFGSAVGIYRAAITIGKEAHIIINERTSSIKPLLEKFEKSDEYPKDMVMTSDEALDEDYDREKTLVVIVDISRRGRLECPELLNKVKDVVVLDHHRKSSDTIENAALSYIEPSASSASEMVAEILRYFEDGLKLRAIEADAMYGGIMIDTNNFSNKAGVRTFEACAFLRKCGADVTRVHSMYRESFEDFRVKASAISQAESYKERFAMTDCPSKGVDSPTVLGAQIANELLDIKGVKASFVFTNYNEKIYISARSTGEVSVQLIMEKLGGGGHIDIAGAQLEDSTIEEARDLVKRTIKEMEENKEL